MIKNLLSDDEPETQQDKGTTITDPKNGVLGLFDSSEDPEVQDSFTNITPVVHEPESMAETVRRSGMAYSAAIAFTAAVVFMLILGWGADVLLGTSPWGIVAGIILGSTIGFIQFFRITSQIFKK